MSADLFNQTVYVIDSIALINLKNKFDYDNKVFKAIWDEIKELIQNNALITIDFVEKEIIKYYLGKN